MVSAFEASPDLPLAASPARCAGGRRSGRWRVSAGDVSAALLVVDRESFPYVDLRADDHAQPIAELARLWSKYEPEADAYVIRAVDPEAAVPPPGMKLRA